MTRLTLAQARPSRCSGWLTFTHPNYHFRQAAAQPTKRFNSSRGGPKQVPYIKMARMCPNLRPNSLRIFVLLFFRARDFERSLFSKSPTYSSYKHASYYLGLSLSTYLDNKLRSRMKLELKNLANSIIKRAVRRGLIANCSKINP